MEKIALFGCSKGLGRSVALELAALDWVKDLLLVSRSVDLLETLKGKLSPTSVQTYFFDLSQKDKINELVSTLDLFSPHRIFYFAGGGPFGKFEEKNWKDHQWALDVNFLMPAQILHTLLVNLKSKKFNNLQQIIFTGSHIAEDRPDPLASSYCAAKHGLKGLITSLQKENESLDLRLFSPTYMDTKMLPPQSRPRVQKEIILNPKFVAKELVSWSMKDKVDKHFILEKELF